MTNTNLFIEAQFPTDIAYKSKGGAGFDTAVFTSVEGFEQRNINWSRSRSEYDIGYGVRTVEDMTTVVDFFMSVMGKAYAFRFKDWADFNMYSQQIGVGDGTTLTFQVIKTYTIVPQSGSNQVYTRIINKPVVGSIGQVLVNSVPISSSDWSLDCTTGILTFSAGHAPGSGLSVVLSYLEFDVPCRFDVDKLEVAQEAFQAENWQGIKIVEVRIANNTALTVNIPAFVEAQFPNDIAYGSKGGSGFNTSVFTTASGYEARTINWAASRAEYDIGYGVRDSDVLADVLNFFMAVMGKAIPFRFKDWADFQVINQVIGTGDGSTLTFQIIKEYVLSTQISTTQTFTRTISKPVLNTIGSVLVNGTPVSSANWSLDCTTGIITFASGHAPGSMQPVMISYVEFDVPCRFDVDKLDVSQDDFNQEEWTGIKLVEVRL
jgi:uncharacterized protein (TIGR02217 family)